MHIAQSSRYQYTSVSISLASFLHTGGDCSVYVRWNFSLGARAT